MSIPSWLYISQLTGGSGTTVITVSAGTNDTTFSKYTNVLIETTNKQINKEVSILELAGKPIDYESEYLTFQMLSAGTIVWKKSNTNADNVTIYYSKDNGSTWTSITSSTAGTSIAVSVGERVKFKGSIQTNDKLVGINYYFSYFEVKTKCNVYGNIMSLTYEDNYIGQTTLNSGGTFYSIFNNSTGIVSVENLFLPATTLTEHCYERMFRGCTSLTTVPSELPANTLTLSCYDSMFYNCTKLNSVPSNYLPATSLADYCYEYMFAGTSLTTLPNLPITALTAGCYMGMFSNCTKLNSVPSNYLPATTLATSCYSNMFYGCTRLTTLPELPATTLVNSCYGDMFYGCSNLTSVPSNYLPATTLANSCYIRMFKNCTSLVTAPELPATTLISQCYANMFQNCTSLTSAPELPASALTQSCYGYMFDGCTSLNYIKCLALDISASNCTYKWVQNVAPSGTFIRAASMIDWPVDSVNGIPIGWTNKYLSQYLTFDILSSGTITWIKSNIFASDRTIEYSKDNGSTWTSITSSRDGVSFSVNSGDKVQFRGTNAHFATSNVNYTYFQTTCKFKVNGNIMSLLYGDNFASQNTLQSSSTFCCMFINNTGLTDAEFLELPATVIKGSCYEGLFSGCTSLAKAPAKLPSTAMEYECYENMFGGCTSLTTAPILPATSLSNSCYSGMFDGCSSLNYIKAMFTTTPGVAYTSNWVRNVASSGTFVKNSSATWTTTGNNGIPNNWTVQEV